jgi:glycerol-3-phosphate dehydrogenase (NAD+)
MVLPHAERSQIRESWDALMRWSKVFRTRKDMGSPLELTRKIAVFGGGSFGTAIAASLASQKEDLEVGGQRAGLRVEGCNKYSIVG